MVCSCMTIVEMAVDPAAAFADTVPAGPPITMVFVDAPADADLLPDASVFDSWAPESLDLSSALSAALSAAKAAGAININANRLDVSKPDTVVCCCNFFIMNPLYLFYTCFICSGHIIGALGRAQMPAV